MTTTAPQPSGSPTDGLQELPPVLRRELRRELRRWRVGTNAYGCTYYGLRIVLILASAIVAADQNLGNAKGNWLLVWVPALSLSVAVMTAVDTWLKPQQKWRGFMESRDALADLLVQAEGGLPADEVRARFLKLRQRHRERNIF
ncbi:DUF4231 domain-containing protein [Streptomyces sp. NPDC049837]|uniref:DUF4231 domain-containing protein n=1 Tax=Streptomyces sp. NPDC049837 TaxID=3155277 RepID=UPI00341F1585